jgi:transposase
MDIIPNVQVVADRFHVALQVNKELDTQRKREKIPATDLENNTKLRSNKVECKQLLEGLNKSKYPLLKNEQDLNEKQNIKLMQVKTLCQILKIMHELKEDFRQIFEKTTNWLKALFKLGQLHKKAQKYFPNSGNTIIQWLDEIMAYFDNRTTSGLVEGINNKLKLIKRSAYGFRNFDNYKNRCLLTWHFNC